MKSGTISRTITDDTVPGSPQQHTIAHTSPFGSCDREADYATAWAAFEQRGINRGGDGIFSCLLLIIYAKKGCRMAKHER